MTYLAILAIIAILLWFLLEKSSWTIFLLVSILLFWLAILATNFNFPFWKIYSPQTGVALAFTLILFVFPITVINGIALSKAIMMVSQNGRRKPEYILILIILTLGIWIFGFGFIHNAYQSSPANNFTLYLKHREHIVSLIKAGTLHGERNCIQKFIDESEFDLYFSCQERIELPDKYKGLSRNGKVDLTQTKEQLSIRFTHSTYGFGDGLLLIIYSSSNKGGYESKWENQKGKLYRK